MYDLLKRCDQHQLLFALVAVLMMQVIHLQLAALSER